ncbi:translation initiation factor 2 [Pseudomonas sp. NPDC090202]|uniref:translation initiation factor 2 n=1 Tax=unclassified Pseudomonas TaxID=196821 RepID=UPI00380F6FFE
MSPAIQRASILVRAFSAMPSMKSLRCVGVVLMVVLGGCDADKSPAPPAKVAVQTPVAPVVEAPPAITPVAPVEKKSEPIVPVHELAPNVKAVPVVAASKPVPAETPTEKKKSPRQAVVEPSGNAKSAKIKADNAEVASRAPQASKTKTPAQVVKETRLPSASLDLSLPPEMVKQLSPPAGVITAAPRSKPQNGGAKPLLPKMFPDSQSESDFQLQGRLLSNEMQLQLRNEARKEVEGAALDFKFKQ